MDRFTLDACDWPLIINDGDAIVAQFPLPKGSTGDDKAGREQVRLANLITNLLNAQLRRPASKLISCGKCGDEYDPRFHDEECPHERIERADDHFDAEQDRQMDYGREDR